MTYAPPPRGCGRGSLPGPPREGATTGTGSRASPRSSVQTAPGRVISRGDAAGAAPLPRCADPSPLARPLPERAHPAPPCRAQVYSKLKTEKKKLKREARNKRKEEREK